MLKRDREDKNTMYLCLPGIRLIFRNSKSAGWYRP